MGHVINTPSALGCVISMRCDVDGTWRESNVPAFCAPSQPPVIVRALARALEPDAPLSALRAVVEYVAGAA